MSRGRNQRRKDELGTWNRQHGIANTEHGMREEDELASGNRQHAIANTEHGMGEKMNWQQRIANVSERLTIIYYSFFSPAGLLSSF
jgi:hypothetical protein